MGSFHSYAQILNPSFENWNSGEPDNWLTYNIPTIATTATQTSDSYAGSSSIQLEIINFNGIPWPTFLQAMNDGDTPLGHPVSAKYNKMKGYFKLDLKGTAQFTVAVSMLDETQTQYVGGGEIIINQSAANWTMFEVPIEYYIEQVPSYMWIYFILADSTGNDDISSIGSVVKIDNLTADGTTEVEVNGNAPLVYSLNQNYPNPFNPTTTIKYSIADNNTGDIQDVNLVVFDVLGSKVATLVNETQQPGNYEVNFDASNIPSGVYFYRIQAGKFIDTKKMILLR